MVRCGAGVLPPSPMGLMREPCEPNAIPVYPYTAPYTPMKRHQNPSPHTAGIVSAPVAGCYKAQPAASRDSVFATGCGTQVPPALRDAGSSFARVLKLAVDAANAQLRLHTAMRRLQQQADSNADV
jgi:hypothetical protein